MSPAGPYVVALTGGIGSGKSTVAELFAERGAALVDTDAIAHRLTAADGAAMPALIAAFGPAIATAAGALDRAAMRAVAFADPEARQRLEAILHPLIRDAAAAECASATAPYVILAVPLLVETGNWRQRCDRVLVVDCAPATQLARVMARSGLDEAEVRRILAAQASREARLAVADDCIGNDGERAALPAAVAALHQKYLAFAAGKKLQANS